MPKRLVLIEDSKLQATRIQQELLDYGFQVELAHTGAVGVARVHDVRPAAIILDVALPDTDGYTLCQQFKADAELGSIPIVILTSRDEREATTEGLNVGADAYIAKDRAAVENVVAALSQFGINADFDPDA